MHCKVHDLRLPVINDFILPDVEMGSEEEEADLFPQTQVGYNSSGKVDVSSDGIHVEGVEEQGNLTNVRQKRDTGQLLLEPGRYGTNVWLK